MTLNVYFDSYVKLCVIDLVIGILICTRLVLILVILSQVKI